MDDVTSDDKLWAALAWALTPLLPIIIMLMADKKERPFIRSHNGQALVWGVINIVQSIVLGAFTFGCTSLVMWAIGLYFAVQAYQGKEVTIPVITDFVKNQGWG